jgi:hypothetical protein
VTQIVTRDDVNDVRPHNNPVAKTCDYVISEAKLMQYLRYPRFSSMLDERNDTVNNGKFERLVAEVLDEKVPICSVGPHPGKSNQVQDQKRYMD